MNILLIGSGGREHALAYILKKSPLCEQLYAAPGNGGILSIADPAEIDVNDHDAVVSFCKHKLISFVVIGPEAPLVAGLSDRLESEKIRVFGPSKAAARLEGSKEFTKSICKKYEIPTAAYESFTDPEKAKTYVQNHALPIVIKADGLAAGKGVVIAQTHEEALQAIDEMMVESVFGDAGKRLVIEEFLQGEELSFFALVDGKVAIPFGSAQDHKAVGEGDTGPNTGGMGTYSPAPIATKAFHSQVMKEIITPLVNGMAEEGCPYKGVLFAGLMVDESGPKLLEINVRFGDPETQVLMARLESDLLPLMLATAKGDLAGLEVELKPDAALCVVMAAKGYPGAYEKGSVIKGLDEVKHMRDVLVFHAGTTISDRGDVLASGGRVLGVTAVGIDVESAQRRAYQAVDTIDWPQGFCRRDIGWRAMEKKSLVG